MLLYIPFVGKRVLFAMPCDEGSWVPDVVLAGCESVQTRARMPDRDRFDYRRLRHRVYRGRGCDCSCHQRGDRWSRSSSFQRGGRRHRRTSAFRAVAAAAPTVQLGSTDRHASGHFVHLRFTLLRLLSSLRCHQVASGDNSESRQRQRSAAGRVRMARSRSCL